MQITNKIDPLITKLTELEPSLSDGSSINEQNFNELLSSSITTGNTATDEAMEVESSTNTEIENGIPSWVNPSFEYDPQNPRKPNLRELMEAMSGKGLGDLYAETDKNWHKIRDQASDLLYGVIGANEDTRDWLSIMASKNIQIAVQEETRAMYEPEVDIKSNFNDDGILTEQIAVITDNKGNTLRSLSSNIAFAEETLRNFGASKKSIPENLEDRIDKAMFDDNLLAFLKNFGNKPASIEQVVVQSASEVIANKLSQEIPLDELAKL